MAEKTTNGQRYRIDGKTFEWTTEDGDTVLIPMRIKLKVIRAMSGQDLDAATMFEILDKIAPGQGAVLDEMDVNDFQMCFSTWQDEYQKLAGATPGE